MYGISLIFRSRVLINEVTFKILSFSRTTIDNIQRYDIILVINVNPSFTLHGAMRDLDLMTTPPVSHNNESQYQNYNIGEKRKDNCYLTVYLYPF